MSNGDTYTIIYLKMLLLAMKNDGGLTWTGLEESIADELALDLDEETKDVGATLDYLISCGLAETSDNASFFFPYSVENTGSESSSAQRVREYRERQKMLQCNTDVTPVKHLCNVEKEINIEKEIENNILGDNKLSPRCTDDVQRVITAWNAVGINPVFRISSGSTRYKMLNARIKEYGIESVITAIENIRFSPFLKGQSKKGWSITFDWFVKPNNFIKVLEGNYDDKAQSNSSSLDTLAELHDMFAQEEEQ